VRQREKREGIDLDFYQLIIRSGLACRPFINQLMKTPRTLAEGLLEEVSSYWPYCGVSLNEIRLNLLVNFV
jgi:hypothetical protein